MTFRTVYQWGVVTGRELHGIDDVGFNDPITYLHWNSRTEGLIYDLRP